jgi:hypothetical protein
MGRKPIMRPFALVIVLLFVNANLGRAFPALKPKEQPAKPETYQERIIGVWKVVKSFGYVPVAPETFEFKSDGNWARTMGGDHAGSGRYRVKDCDLLMSGEGRLPVCTILQLSDEWLVVEVVGSKTVFRRQ